MISLLCYFVLPRLYSRKKRELFMDTYLYCQALSIPLCSNKRKQSTPEDVNFCNLFSNICEI